MKNLHRQLLLALSAAILTLSLSACSLFDEPDDKNKTESSTSNKHSNASVWVTNVKMKKLSGNSWYQVSYTVKSSGAKASEIDVLGCTANRNPSRYSSSKKGVTSYSYTSNKASSVNTILTPYIKFKDGTRIDGKSTFTSANK